MTEPLAVPRLRLVTPALPERPVAVPSLPSDVPLLQEDGVLVTSECVVARGRTLALSEVLRVETVRRSPRMWPALATLGLGMSVGLPALSALSVSRRGFAEAALILAALAIFGSIARLLLAEDSYRLVLHTERGAWHMVSSPEPRRVHRLAGLIHEAVTTARRRR